jgi:hypothetical protein
MWQIGTYLSPFPVVDVEASCSFLSCEQEAGSVLLAAPPSGFYATAEIGNVCGPSPKYEK